MFDQVFIAALNHLLEGASWARTRLIPFAGRRARFDIPPLALGFEIAPDGRVIPNPGSTDVADVVIRLPVEAPFLLPQGLDKLMSQATVEGNAEFATEISFVFRNLRWDAEEDLSKLVGDIAAHRVVQGISRFMGWQKQATTNLAENVAEYLTIEKPVLVPRHELHDLRDAIAKLDADLGRAESRLTSLSR
jgi:ubiquinone biosynthesis protein UbiJ